MPVDFLARSPYLVPHLVPIWDKLDPSERGVFYANGAEVENALAMEIDNRFLVAYQDGGDCGDNPIVTAAYGDAVRAADYNTQRPVVLMEHGIGLTFGKAAYADGLGQREKLSLMPVQSEYVLRKVHPEIAHKPHPVVGMPKMDAWAREFDKPHIMPKTPTLVIAFHHGDKNSRPGETGSAWEHYIDILPILARKYKLMVHFHPTSGPLIREACARLGLEVVQNFKSVLKLADVFINDASSTAYEFCVTGKPVILLNAPWFNRKSRYGIRFWDYADIGEQVDEPDRLDAAIQNVIRYPEQYLNERRKAVHDLFPYLGTSAERTVEEIRNHLKTNRYHSEPRIQPRRQMDKKSTFLDVMTEFFTRHKLREGTQCGLLYMCFGEAAIAEMENSVSSLRRAGSTLPVALVGDDMAIKAATIGNPPLADYVIRWEGENPFDPDRNPNFQFRAGRVKPFLYGLSPFEHTLYVDCDVEFLIAPDDAFGFLDHWDFVIAQERLALAQLYNRRGAGWEHDIHERDETIKAFGGSNGDFPFWNSGVFFWRKNKKVEELFALWYREWLIFQGWDEQKALMRAGNASDARIFVLSEIWNYPHREEMTEKYYEQARIILHEYGKGAARTDVK